MKHKPSDYNGFYTAIRDKELVFLFGTGISSTLTGQPYSWRKWIQEGIKRLADHSKVRLFSEELAHSFTTKDLVSIAGKVIESAKEGGSYNAWMHDSFETNAIQNKQVVDTLKKLILSQVVFATTNYDLLLEKATGLKSASYENPDRAFSMLDQHISSHVLHIHGIYDSAHGIDSIIADEKQYNSVLENEGAQFIQNILGTRTIVLVGCGNTIEDPNISRFIEFANKHLKMDQTYYYLCKEPVAGLPNQMVQIQYGDDYNDLPPFLEVIAQIRLRKRIESNRIVGRTAFTKPIITRDSLLQYHFSQRTIPFCGRCKELSELQLFIEKDVPFSWWAVTGQAGSGKSRLAMELLYQLPTSWFGFFLNDEVKMNDVDTFVPFCNTLVVMDYVAGKERLVSKSLCALKKVFATTSYHLRILLLERENNRESGSWYSKFIQRTNRTDIDQVKAAEYADSFLNLVDMEETDIKTYISAVCATKGVKITDAELSALYEIYGNKYERLRFRPLFVQLFVESWIDNSFSVPNYSNFTSLLEAVLNREQTRWLESVNRDHNVCNAFIRLMIRASISGRISIQDIPEIYQKDWDTIRLYIASNSFIGKQREELQDSLINSFCHNIDSEHMIIAPQFPDIIKECMFSYYTDKDFLPVMMKEIWQHSSSAFSSFIMRCMMDFPEQEFFAEAINAYKASTHDHDVLAGRLAMLQGKLIQKGEDPWVYWDIIDNEHEFWKSIEIPEGITQENDALAFLKLTGLYRVAQHIGAWSMYDLSEMENVIDEMLSVKGGKATEILKKTYLQEHITALSTKGFFDEAKRARELLDKMIGDGEDEYDSLLRMQNYNDRMMQALFEDDIQRAKRVLLEMESKCNYMQLESVKMLAHSCWNFDQFSMITGHEKESGIGYRLIEKCEKQYPANHIIRERRIGCQAVQLQIKHFEKDISTSILHDRVLELENELSMFSVEGNASDDAFDTAWGAVKTLKLNIATEEEIKSIINEARAILKQNIHLTSVATTMISAVRALHHKHLHDRVTHEEVEELYSLLENNADSESVRSEFFEMLEESVDASRRQDYFNTDIIREAINDAQYNPISGSGIPEIDDWIEGGLYEIPAVRPYPKIGRNDPCPCGSGKKYKKCCMGKGVFD